MFGGPWLSGILAAAIGIQPMFGVTAFVCLALGLLGARLAHREAGAIRYRLKVTSSSICTQHTRDEVFVVQP